MNFIIKFKLCSQGFFAPLLLLFCYSFSRFSPMLSHQRGRPIYRSTTLKMAPIFFQENGNSIGISCCHQRTLKSRGRHNGYIPDHGTVKVEDILFWTSNQLKGVEVKMEKFDLSRLIDDNVNLFQTIAHNKRITMSHQGPKNLTIRSDKNILNFVMRNLIGNAIKFSYEGGSVSILVSKENNFPMIQVQDQGVGMDEQTMTSLLRPVGAVSSSGTSNETGTGLGVGLCREYLQKIGGQLSVESSKGNGTTFSVLLMGEGQ